MCRGAPPTWRCRRHDPDPRATTARRGARRGPVRFGQRQERAAPTHRRYGTQRRVTGGSSAVRPPLGLAGASLQHAHASGRGGRAGRTRPGEDLRLRSHRVPVRPPREPPHVHADRPDPADAGVRGVRRHGGPEHHRRRTHDRRILPRGGGQDAVGCRGRGAAAARDRREVHAGGARRHGRRRDPSAGRHAEGHRPYPRDDRPHGHADRARARLRRRDGLRLLRRHAASPGTGSSPATRWTS